MQIGVICVVLFVYVNANNVSIIIDYMLLYMT